MDPRVRTAGIAAAALLAGLALLLWPRGPEAAPPEPEVHAHAHAPAGRRGEPAPHVEVAPRVIAAGATPEELDRLTREAIASGASLSEGLDLPPPAVTGAQIALPPRPAPVSDEEILDQKVEGIDAIDRTLDRLEADLQAVEAAGDETQAHRLRLRIARLEQTRVERVAEIEADLAEEEAP